MPQVQQLNWDKLKPKSIDIEDAPTRNPSLADIGNWKSKTSSKFAAARLVAQVSPKPGRFRNP